MRDSFSILLEKGRVRTGPYATDNSWGPFGAFNVRGPCGESLRLISSGAYTPTGRKVADWEHVSVSTKRRIPNWEEMCFVKNLFWGPEECVVQFHPPESEWVNNHLYCLHLWRSVVQPFPRLPSIMVGVRDAGVLSGAQHAEALRRKYGLEG